MCKLLRISIINFPHTVSLFCLLCSKRESDRNFTMTQFTHPETWKPPVVLLTISDRKSKMKISQSINMTKIYGIRKGLD